MVLLRDFPFLELNEKRNEKRIGGIRVALAFLLNIAHSEKLQNVFSFYAPIKF